MHDLTVITMLAGALAAALFLGWLTQRLGLSQLVGYLLAGIAVGPHTPGFVADPQLASQLSEIGVILLMFGVGLHFHPKDLLRVWRIAVPGAVAQSVAATVFGWAIAQALGWASQAGLILGMALAVASTVVLMRMLEAQGRLSAPDGHVAVGWLIVEDIFTVVALVILPALALEAASPQALAQELAAAIGKVAVFAGLVWFLGPRLCGPLLERLARSGSRELFTLAVFVLALSVAAVAAGIFHVSVALGAFLGGLVVAQSRIGHQAAADMLPFRDVFSALFFVSVGMLFDPGFIVANPGLTVAALAVVLVVKPLVALLLVLLLRGTPATAATVAVGLAQIGEFSFILGALGKSLGLLPDAGFSLLVATALISIAVNPVVFRASPVIESWLARRRRATPAATQPAAPAATGTAVLLVGYGRTGRRIAAALGDGHGAIAVVDCDLDAVDAAGRDGLPAFFGSGGSAEVLHAAGLAGAGTVVIAASAMADKMAICLAARQAGHRLRLVALADSDGERAWLEEFGVDEVVDLRREAAQAVVARLGGGA